MQIKAALKNAAKSRGGFPTSLPGSSLLQPALSLKAAGISLCRHSLEGQHFSCTVSLGPVREWVASGQPLVDLLSIVPLVQMEAGGQFPQGLHWQYFASGSPPSLALHRATAFYSLEAADEGGESGRHKNTTESNCP